MMTNDENRQRNDRDVAVELTKIYCEQYVLSAEHEIEEQYAKFYALSTYLSNTDPQRLKSLLPEEILSKIGRL